MSVRKYLSELDGERLIELFEQNNDAASEESRTKDRSPQRVLYDDLGQNYSGLVKFAEHLWEGFEKNGANESFMAGAKAGSILLIHVIRLAAEIDEISPSTGTSA